MLTIPAHTIDELLDALVGETLRVRYAWDNYRLLFVDEQTHVDVLNATAPDFFRGFSDSQLMRLSLASRA